MGQVEDDAARIETSNEFVSPLARWDKGAISPLPLGEGPGARAISPLPSWERGRGRGLYSLLVSIRCATQPADYERGSSRASARTETTSRCGFRYAALLNLRFALIPNPSP